MANDAEPRYVVEDLKGEKVVVVHTLNGNVIVSQNVANQVKENSRRVWRPLSHFAYPTAEFAHDFVTNFRAHLVFHLHRTFREAGYTQFTSLIKIETVTFNNQEMKVITLTSQHSRYTGALHSGIKRLWDVTQDREALQNEQNADLVYLQKNWAVRANLLATTALVPYRFVYDAEGLNLSIEPIKEGSTDPSDYPEKVSRTSELFTFLAAYTRANVAIANFNLIAQSYALSKLMLQLGDEHSFSLENIRIDAADPEVWDYINPDADTEFSEWSHQLGVRGGDH